MYKKYNTDEAYKQQVQEEVIAIINEENSPLQNEAPVKLPKGWEHLKVGDKVMYKGEVATVHDFEDYDEYRPLLDTGMAPVMYEVAEWDAIEPVATQEKAGEGVNKPDKVVKSKKEKLDLLGEVFNQKNNEHGKEEEVQLQSGSGTAEREGGHEPGQNEQVGASEQHEVEGSDGRGMGGRSGKHSVSDNKRSGGVSGLSEKQPNVGEKSPAAPKNTRNNVAERGKDYAPKGENARIEANVKALETMKRLMDNGGQATRKDMEVMRKFSGWGGLGGAFKERTGSGAWAPVNPVNKRLREVLTPEQYEWAKGNASMSQYFTPAAVIDKMWDIARALGFKGGNVLEGSAGIGNILGLMPRDMSASSNIHAVEVDEAIGQMLTLLYPDAKVDIKGFEQAKVANGSVDLSITNVPFVTGLKVFDDSGDADLSKKFRDIHNFCIAKNVRKLREGGIGIFISSNGTLDGSPKLMSWITNEGKSDVVGAFRLNSNTFGGTNATSDIIVVRKRINGKKSANAIDVSKSGVLRVVSYLSRDAKANEKPKDMALTFNQYFIDHPEYMGGEMAFAFEKGETWQETSRRLFPSKDINQEELLANWVKDMQSKDWEASAQESAPREDTSIIYEDLGSDVKEGSMLLDKEGTLCLAQGGKAVPLGVNTNKVKGHTKAECFNDYKAVKDALSAVIEYQTHNNDDKGLAPLLKELNRVYDKFVDRYGNVNKNRNIPFLRKDIDFPGVAALEDVKIRTDKNGKREVVCSKTDIFKHRVVDMETEPKPTNVKDGIIASIYLNGFVNVPYIAGQLGKSEEDVRKEIIGSGLGFENPTTTDIEVSYEYLSGNVREKLAQAKEANTDGRYDANIKALEKIVPMDIPAHLIEFTLGSSWLDAKFYTDYIKEKTDLDVSVANSGGTWTMKTPYYTALEKNKALGIRSEICDKIVLGHQLIEAALQNKTITVQKIVSYGKDNSEKIVDKEASLACANKIDEIRQDFKEWARKKMQSDAKLSEEVERVYNERFNNYVPKEISKEFIPEHFGGAAKVVNGKPFQLREHQAKAVIRATTQPLMLAHEVGTGKTYTLISTAMEMRRLGTARKPMIVVQNATVGQFVGSAKALYPNARILTLEDVDRNKEGRLNFYAKIKYNDWDMIVVPQSVFEKIPDSPERKARYIESKIEEKLRVIEQLNENGADKSTVRNAENELKRLREELRTTELKSAEKPADEKPVDEKRKAKAKQNASVKAQEMLDRETDETMNFDDMGIDALLIDEAHEYKHLGFETAMQRGVKGVDPSFSKKSQGVYLKAQAVMENNNGRNVVFATGTPISNTAAEIWTFMRYLIPEDVMKGYDIFYFDDFVRNFGLIQQTMEFGASGSYKEVNRFMGYINLPELVRIWGSIADTVLTREAGGVNDKIPELEGGKAQDVYLPQTKALRSVMKYVKQELEAFAQMSGKEKKENSHIPLTMFGIAKAAAIDPRLVVNDAADEPNSKTNEAVRQTLKSLKETKRYKGVVAIFADNYENKRSGFNLYEDIRKKLIQEGVPAEEVVVMKSGMTDNKKLEIFDKANAGEIRVLLGSTRTLGTGVNIQERLHTLIHMDAPVRPMDYTQRNGRILRQGNSHKDWGIPVRVIRFGVEDSLDVTAYQRLKTKGAIADSIMNGKAMIGDSMNNRMLEEESDVFSDITAQLSGSQYALLKNQLEKEIKKLESRKSQHEQDQTYIYYQKPRLKAQIVSAKERKAVAEKALEKVTGAEGKEIVIGKKRFGGTDAMQDYIKDFNKLQHEAQERVRTGKDDKVQSSVTVNVGGIDFVIESETTQSVKFDATGRSISAQTKMHYSCDELGLEGVPVERQLLKNALTDIMENVMSGRDFRERMETSDRVIARCESSLEQMAAREGKPFEDEEKLDKALSKLNEYEELMKAELAAKEAKYAEMDKDVDMAEDVTVPVEEDEDDENSYREVVSVNDEFNEALRRYKEGKMDKNEIFHLGLPYGAIAQFIPNLPIVMRQHTVRKGTEKKHHVSIEALENLPKYISNPIFIFQKKGGDRIGILTEIKDENGKNVCVAIEMNKTIQDGKDFLQVNDIRSFHEREVENIIKPINENNSLLWMDKEKGLNWITSALHNFRQAQSNKDLSSVSKMRKNIENESGEGNIKQTLTEKDILKAMDAIRSFENPADGKINIASVVNEVNRLSENLHTPIRVEYDENNIPGNSSMKRKAKGWFNPKTGEIVVFAPNAESVDDAVQTVLHEAVAHKGLRKLFGEHFNTFLENVYNNASKGVRSRINALMAKNGWNMYKATDEYLASLAERTNFEEAKKQGWWKKVKDFFIEMLAKAGVKLPTLTDNELRYILWRSYENLKNGPKGGPNGGIFTIAEDIAMQSELEVGNYAPSNSSAVNEAKSIVEEAKKNGTYMKAPNGKPSHLNERQWAQVRTKAFKQWFGDWEKDPENASKVVDENGEPMVVYHGTWDDVFYEFDRDKLGENTDSNATNEDYAKTAHVGFWFNTNKIEYAENYIPAFLNIRDPWEAPSLESLADDMSYYESGEDFAESSWNDGVVIRNDEEMGGTSYAAFGPTQIKSATDNNGNFDPTDPDIRFRTNEKPSGDAAREYNKAVRTPNKGGTVKGNHNIGYRLREAYQDSMLALKKLQDAIAHETGKKVNDFENAYMAENRMSSINNTEKEVYMRDYMHPVFDAVSKLLSDGKSTLDDINNYLMAKHGLERNEYFREKAGREAADKWANDTIKAEMANGKDEDEAQQIADAGKEAIYDEVIDSLQDADYSGLTELTQLEDEEVNEEFTERAEKLVADFEGEHDVSELWDTINAATNESLKKSYKSGMLSLENYEYIKNMFDYYVPLRGWDNNEAGKEYDYLTNNRMHLSPAVIKMRGRKSKADNVLAFIGFSGESSIIQGNRNKMKQHLLNLVVNHPTDLARASKQWYVLDNATGEWEERYPSFPDDATPEQINAIVDSFNEKMLDLKDKGLAKQGKINLSTGMHIKRSEQPEHIVKVMRNGQPMNVYINGNPRAAQAVNGILNPDNVSDTIVHRWAQAVKHFMARNFTSQNPAFVFSNLARDVIWADNAVNIKEDKTYRQQFRKNLKKILLSWKTMPLLKKFENGTLDDSNEFEKYFNEFLMNGGETGFTAINTVEDYKRDINRYVEQAQKGVAVPKKAWRKFWDSVEFINRTVEDVSRFATYMTSRQQGRSIERSIWDAKEITVNFNKKGSGEFGARYFNFAYVFFNAAIQSIANIAKLTYNNPGKMGKTAVKFVTIGMLLPAYSILASMLMGDDDEDKDAYFDLPKWVRENNMVFYILNSATLSYKIKLKY